MAFKVISANAVHKFLNEIMQIVKERKDESNKLIDEVSRILEGKPLAIRQYVLSLIVGYDLAVYYLKCRNTAELSKDICDISVLMLESAIFSLIDNAMNYFVEQLASEDVDKLLTPPKPDPSKFKGVM